MAAKIRPTIGSRFRGIGWRLCWLHRMGEIAEQARVMRVQCHPAVASLKDAPDPAQDDGSECAELRVSAQANQVYETRNFDQTEKAMSSRHRHHLQ